MTKKKPISEHLIRIKAYEIWMTREQNGEYCSPETDWKEAREWLSESENKWAVFWWKFWLRWDLPSLFADPTNRNFALDVVKTVISALGLLATAIAAVGLFVSYMNSQKELRIAEKRLITDRFSKAVELLGSKESSAHLGGIYSLDEIAREYPKDYHWRIMEVLTSYVRIKSAYPDEIKSELKDLTELSQRGCPLPKQKGGGPNRSFSGQKDCYPRLNEKLNELLDVSEDVQVILTVIKTRNDEQENKDEGQILDLSYSNLKRANLEGAKLEQANLTRAYLKRANLTDVNLTKANLLFIDLVEAELKGANLPEAKLMKADLLGANLQDANLQDANLQDANLPEAKLMKADLLRADLLRANLQDANLQDANLQDANLQGANLQGANLQGANLQGANLLDANLLDANLEKARYTTEKTKLEICKKYALYSNFQVIESQSC